MKRTLEFLQELSELQMMYNNVKTFYYSDEKTAWILEFKNDCKEEEFELKQDMYYWLMTERNE